MYLNLLNNITLYNFWTNESTFVSKLKLICIAGACPPLNYTDTKKRDMGLLMASTKDCGLTCANYRLLISHMPRQWYLLYTYING